MEMFKYLNCTIRCYYLDILLLPFNNINSSIPHHRTLYRLSIHLFSAFLCEKLLHQQSLWLCLFSFLKDWQKLINYEKFPYWPITSKARAPFAEEISSSQFPHMLSSNEFSISQFSLDMVVRVSWSPALLYFPILSTCGSIPTLSRTPEAIFSMQPKLR